MGKVKYSPGDQPYRLAVYQVRSKTDLPAIFSTRYSQMKYGYPPAVKYMAEIMAKRIIHSKTIKKIVELEGRIMLAGSVYWGVPRGATVLTWEVSNLLNQNGIPSECFKINYDGDHNKIKDYAAMDATEREKILSGFDFWLDDTDKARVSERTILIIDDACMTGAHEKKVYEALKRCPIKGSVFGYLINFSGSMAQENPHYEEELNRFGYDNPLEALVTLLVEIPGEPELVINARTIRIILSSAEKGRDVKSFYSQLTDSVLLKIYKAAVSKDNYFRQPATMKGFQVLHSYLLEKGLVTPTCFEGMQELEFSLLTKMMKEFA